MADAKKNPAAVATGGQLARGLREVALLISSTASLFFLIALFSFDLEDAGWSHSGTGSAIKNLGGAVGAWISDLFLSVFGIMAYLFPVMLAYHGILFYLGRHERNVSWMLGLRWFGFFVTVTAGAVLAYLHFLRLQLPLPGTSGGLVGQEVGDILIASFGVTGSTLILLATLLGGVTLFTGLSWLKLLDSVGKWSLSALAYGFRLLRLAYTRTSERRETAKAEQKSKRPTVARVKKAVKKIEPVVPASVQPSERARKESQLPLFEPAQGSLPPLSLLDKIRSQGQGYSKGALETISRQLEQFMNDFGVEAEVVDVLPGPVITRFEIQPAAGVKISRISGLSKDLARVLSVSSVRIVEVIPGKSVVGLEIPNEVRETVSLREVLSSRQYENSNSPITLVLGKDIAGQPVVADLARMPHLLVAGTTGSGKSVAVNAMILSMLYKSTPEQVRLIMIDPKMLELSVYEGIPHLLTPVVTDMKLAANALRWCVAEMERRYRLMSLLGVRNLAGFNRKVGEAEKNGEPIPDPMFDPSTQLALDGEVPVLKPLPVIVIVIDELADMMMIVGKKVEELIARLAQKARAAGLHLILATQRPSVDVLTGLIKANVPTRIAFQVSSKIDSRTILDQGGAEALLGNGDMLFLPPGTSVPNRAHGAFVDDQEVHRVVEFLRASGPADYLEEVIQDGGDNGSGNGFGEEAGDEADPLYDEAVRIVTESRRASISSVQRRLKVGYNRAARMIEDMERAGVVSEPESNGMREVLAPPPVED